MQLWVLRDCEIEHMPYQAGQRLEVSEVLGTHLQRCSPESFTDVDPAMEAERAAAELAAQQALEEEACVKAEQEQAEAKRKQQALEVEPEEKALDAAPKDKQVKGAPKSK